MELRVPDIETSASQDDPFGAGNFRRVGIPILISFGLEPLRTLYVGSDLGPRDGDVEIIESSEQEQEHSNRCFTSFLVTLHDFTFILCLILQRMPESRSLFISGVERIMSMLPL